MGVQSISVPQNVASALTTAGERSGVDFSYLLQTAMRESSLNPSAKAGTSSATGLFQFLSATWLQVMKEQGPRLGYGEIANEIQKLSDGSYTVADPARREAILKLREDPQISADLAAAFTRSNGEYLKNRFGRNPSGGELYIAHFLGAEGAERMFNAGLQDPDQLAVNLFPRQADANQAIFYSDGKPRTIREVYRVLVAKHETGTNAAFSAQQISGQTPGVPEQLPPIPSRFSPDNMSFTGLFKTVPDEPVAPAGGSAFFTQLYAR